MTGSYLKELVKTGADSNDVLISTVIGQGTAVSIHRAI